VWRDADINQEDGGNSQYKRKDLPSSKKPKLGKYIHKEAFKRTGLGGGYIASPHIFCQKVYEVNDQY